MTVFKGMRYLLAGIPIRPFAILYNMHSLASFLILVLSDRDLHPNVWSILITLDVLWCRCKTFRSARRWIISSLFICVAVYGFQTVQLFSRICLRKVK